MLKGLAYYRLENAYVALGPSFRKWGQSLFRSGMVAQGASAYEDTVQPSLRCVAVSDSKFPRLLDVGAIDTDIHAIVWHSITNYKYCFRLTGLLLTPP